MRLLRHFNGPDSELARRSFLGVDQGVSKELEYLTRLVARI